MYVIYANIWGILMVNVIIYSSTMDPMGISYDYSSRGIPAFDLTIIWRCPDWAVVHLPSLECSQKVVEEG